MPVTTYSPNYEDLKRKWAQLHTDLQEAFWEKHEKSLNWLDKSTKQLMLGSVTGLVMLTHPATTPIYAERLLPPPLAQANNKQVVAAPARTQEQLISDLKSLLPETVQPLTYDQQTAIGQKLTEYFGMTATAVLQGKQLNRSYGIIGAEQHLMRYPGDTIDTHFHSTEDARFAGSGMAPGRGAWGYFARSSEEMTQKDIEREKYYIAVQTFLSPGWNENVNEMYNFFKFRKMLVVNPENGKAMVVVVGDAGPAEWTGKHLGGSPEVMSYLERQDGGARGPVLYYFLDDPQDTIPLGPVSIK